MKTEIKNEVQSGIVPFASSVHCPAPNKEARELAPEVLSGSIDIANIQGAAGNVHFLVRPHYVNLATGVYGIQRLIVSILQKRSAVFARGAEHTDLRPAVIAVSLYASDIIREVRAEFGADKYPDSTIYCFLSHDMREMLGAVKLSGKEDKPRTSRKPRLKYYLLNTFDVDNSAAKALPENREGRQE